jgi:serine/threonine-protein kinase RsbW
MLVRQALTGIGEALQLDAADINDINTAVTEACNNVVVHAYRGDEGPLEVDLYPAADALEVVVRDRGSGIPLPGASSDDGGLGISVIEALSSSAVFRDTGEAGGGTEVCMTFGTPKAARMIGTLPGDDPWVRPWGDHQSESTVQLTCAPSSLAGSILPRLLSALGARAQFTTDRISDLQLVADAIATDAPAAIAADYLAIGMDVESHGLELSVAPLRPGTSELLLVGREPGEATPLARLTDWHRVGSAEDLEAEMLFLGVRDRR